MVKAVPPSRWPVPNNQIYRIDFTVGIGLDEVRLVGIEGSYISTSPCVALQDWLNLGAAVQ